MGFVFKTSDTSPARAPTCTLDLSSPFQLPVRSTSKLGKAPLRGGTGDSCGGKIPAGCFFDIAACVTSDIRQEPLSENGTRLLDGNLVAGCILIPLFDEQP